MSVVKVMVAVVMVVGEEEVYPTPGFIGNVQFMFLFFFFFCQGHVKDSRIPPINFFFLKKLLVMCQAFNILRADL